MSINIKKINPITMKQPTKCYSNGIFVPKEADLLFVTGQVAQDSDGNVIAPFDTEEQTRYIFGQIEKVLNAVGMTFDDVVKTTIFVVDMSKSSSISGIRDEFFINSKPASSMIGVTELVKKECVVEIEVIAAKL